MPLLSYLSVGQLCQCPGGLVLKEELQRIYDSEPEDQPRGRLEPYRELILRWRRQGRTYHRIRELLAVRCKVTVAYVTLYRFIKRSSRPRKVKPELENELTIPQAVEHLPANPPARKSGKLSAEDAAQQRVLIQTLRNKPVVVHEVRKRYEYDPDEPLTLEPTKKDGQP